MSDNKEPKPKIKKILFMTAAGSHNLWDELILKEEINFVQKQYGKNISITACWYDLSDMMILDPSVTLVSYFPNHFIKHPLQNIKYLFKNIWLIAKADVLIIGWWGILFDNEEWVSFWMVLAQWSFRVKLARMTNTVILFWGIWLEITKAKNKMKLKKFFIPWDFILVRDSQSKWLLDALEIPSVQVQDIVFLHEPPLPSKPITEHIRPIGISIRGGFLQDENESVIPRMYDYLVKQWFKPIFLVLSTEWEEAQNDTLFIQRMMVWKTFNMTRDIRQTLDVYPFLHSIIGMRLHSGILACVHNIPFLPISYGMKTDELIKLLWLEHLGIQSTELTLELFISKWEVLVKNYELEKLAITQKHEYYSQNLQDCLKNL